MIYILIIIYIATCIAIFKWGFRSRDRMLQYPFLAASVFLGWALPQLLGLTINQDIPIGFLEKTVLMSWLCMVACWYGYVTNRRAAQLFNWTFSYNKLLISSIILSIIGAYFFFMVGELAADATEKFGGGWTGIITIYVFLSSSLSVGFCLALVLYLSNNSKKALIVLIFGLLFYLYRIVILGRRAAMVELLIMILMGLWFQRRVALSRVVMILIFIVGALLINSIGDYRATMLGENSFAWSGAGLTDILNIDFLGNLMTIASGGGENNFLTTAFSIQATENRLSFDYGLRLWNDFITSYIPAQFFGSDFKNSLMFNFSDNAAIEFGYSPIFGTTPTGITDAFVSFWYFGMVKFFLIGYIMNRWWRAALMNNMAAQLILMLVVYFSLQAITHGTSQFFLKFVDIAIFLVPALYFSKIERIKT